MQTAAFRGVELTSRGWHKQVHTDASQLLQYCGCSCDMLGCIAGQDPHDATSSAKAVPDYAAALQPLHLLSSRPLEGRRIGVIAQLVEKGVAPGVAAAITNSIQHLESLGAQISEVSKSACLHAVTSPACGA